MNLKRQREDSSSPCSFSYLSPSKSALIDPDLGTRTAIFRSWGSNPLHVADPSVHEITKKERHRQIKGLELIASANYVCQAVLDALGSHLTDMYSDGTSGLVVMRGINTFMKLRVCAASGFGGVKDCDLSFSVALF